MNDINELNKTIKEKERLISIADKLNRLKNNLDFKEVVEKYILNEEILRLTQQLSNFNLPKERREQVVLELTSLSTLQNYINSIILNAEVAKQTVIEDQSMLIELRNE